MSIELSKQKLDIDEACRRLQGEINKMQRDVGVLLAAMKAIDEDKENILESDSILAQETKKIMYYLINNI